MEKIKNLVVNIKSKEPYDVYVGRPSKYGNPFSYLYGTAAKYIVSSREEAITAYEEWLLAQPDLVADVKKNLKDKILACHCYPLACHAEVLVRIANEE